MPIKWRYVAFLLVIFVFVVAGPVVLEWYWPNSHILQVGFQAFGIFAALATAVIAVALADRPEREVCIEPQRRVDVTTSVLYKKADISAEHRDSFANYPSSFLSYRVYFTLINRSGFNLKRSMVTVGVPRNRMHPSNPNEKNWRPYINNDLQQKEQPIMRSITDEWWQLTCARIGEWHANDRLKFYLRMVLDRTDLPVSVKIAVSCSNAEGWRDTLRIDAEKLLPAPNV